MGDGLGGGRWGYFFSFLVVPVRQHHRKSADHFVCSRVYFDFHLEILCCVILHVAVLSCPHEGKGSLGYEVHDLAAVEGRGRGRGRLGKEFESSHCGS